MNINNPIYLLFAAVFLIFAIKAIKLFAAARKRRYEKGYAPPPAELAYFAEEFSQNFIKLRPGTYMSENENYVITYGAETLSNGLQGVIGGAVVFSADKKMAFEITSKLKGRYAYPHFIFFIVVWAYYMSKHRHVRYPERYMLADAHAIKYCATVFPQTRVVLNDFCDLLSDRSLAPDSIYIPKRIQHIKKHL